MDLEQLGKLGKLAGQTLSTVNSSRLLAVAQV